ncbi:MAG: hypothetical protein KY395_06685 [Actinobacteria bacterium]|nr:hypothetical protein [Actinomycetota bacterium]
MLNQLEHLSYALGSINREDAKRVCEAAIRKLNDLLRAQVVKLYWAGEAQDGIILNPLAFINNAPGQDDDPKPFHVTAERPGILPWVFREREPLWLEKLQEKDLTQPVRNEATSRDVPAEYLDMAAGGWIDSMMVVPLALRGEVRGLCSVEFQSSGRLSGTVLELLKRLARPLAGLLWGMDVFLYNQERASRAVSEFLSDIADFEFDSAVLIGEERSGFVARPFDRDYSIVEEKIGELLASKGIRARAYQPEGGTRYIIDDIQAQIRRSHFCIADMTGLNPNVVAEVAMMVVMRKHFMLIRRKDDQLPIPFDFGQYPFHEYEAGPSGLRVWNSAQNSYQPFEVVLDRFIERLPQDTGFLSAREFRSVGR